MLLFYTTPLESLLVVVLDHHLSMYSVDVLKYLRLTFCHTISLLLCWTTLLVLYCTAVILASGGHYWTSQVGNTGQAGGTFNIANYFVVLHAVIICDYHQSTPVRHSDLYN